MNNWIKRKQYIFLISAPVTQALCDRVFLPLLPYSVVVILPCNGKGQNIEKGEEAAKWFLDSSGKSVESSSLAWSGGWWRFCFILLFLALKGCGMELGSLGILPGVSICSSYNPVAPKGIPELWLMQGDRLHGLGEVMADHRRSPLPAPLAPAPLFRGRRCPCGFVDGLLWDQTGNPFQEDRGFFPRSLTQWLARGMSQHWA